MIRVIVVDDQRLVHEGFQAMFNMQDTIECKHTFSDGDTFLKEFPGLEADVVLMDIQMPGRNGIEVTRLVKEQYPQLRVLMLTTFHDREYIIDAMKAGANGYVLKDTPFEKLVEAVHTVHVEGAYLLESVTSTVLDYVHQASHESAYEESWQQRYGLTNREIETVFWIKKGLSNQEIAEVLYITPGTVKNHVSNLMDKVGLRERHHIAIYALTDQRPDKLNP